MAWQWLALIANASTYLVAEMMCQKPPQVLAQQVSKCVGDDAAPWAEVAESLRSHQEQNGEQKP